MSGHIMESYCIKMWYNYFSGTRHWGTILFLFLCHIIWYFIVTALRHPASFHIEFICNSLYIVHNCYLCKLST